MKGSDYLRSGILAKAAGVSRDTLRYYERKGIIPKPQRSSNNYREYPPEAIGRLLVARQAMAVGFTLDELAGIFRMREAGDVPCRHVRDLAALKLSKVEHAISELEVLRKTLRLVLKQWNAALARAAPGQRVGLLDSLHTRKLSPCSATYHAAMPLKLRIRKGEPPK